MEEGQRGFTLLETLVTAGILALLLTASFWTLGMHPGALVQAADDFDAALASARALAMTSANGATLVVAPRTDAAGMTMRVYAGRPSGPNSVAATTTMPVVANATVSEATLGTPPFALFFAASGHVSGKGAYPAVDAAGNAAFAPIASEPACPAGGFVLTFRGPQGATATRSLPCTNVAAVGTPGPPNPSPTPNVPLVTPPLLVYHWPAGARQSFVATEWGYTHWFATTSGFACGGVASFPDVLPSPYSPAWSAAEASATPLPPAATPYSFPNSGGGSMNDAPASFPLDPATEGLCVATVADAFGQRASTGVQVMGWLTATYRGNAYTHLSTPQLTLPSSDLPSKGTSVTLALSKTYDSEALQPLVTLDAACSPYVGVATAGGVTPGKPSATPARASVTLTLVTMPASPISCGGTIYDQYPGARRGEGIPFNAAIAPPDPPDIWPPAIVYATSGNTLVPGKTCKAQPYAYDATTNAWGGISTPPPWLPGVTLSGFNCYSGDVWVREPGFTGAFDVLGGYYSTCLRAAVPYLNDGGWTNSSGAGPGPIALVLAANNRTTAAGTPCSLTIQGDYSAEGKGIVTAYAQMGSACVAGRDCSMLVETQNTTGSWSTGDGPGGGGCHSGCSGVIFNVFTEYVSTDGGYVWKAINGSSCGALKAPGCSNGVYDSGTQELVLDFVPVGGYFSYLFLDKNISYTAARPSDLQGVPADNTAAAVDWYAGPWIPEDPACYASSDCFFK